MLLKDCFSVVYHELLANLMQVEVPDEKWADCSDCHFCVHPKIKRFDTKCCDFHPALPNCIVGEILLSDSVDLGKSFVEKKIVEKVGVTPFGILPSLNYQAAFKRTRKFKKEATKADHTALKCPYLHNGGCSIYQFRTGACGTHFCRTVGVSVGRSFWSKVMAFNHHLDKELSIFIAEQMGIDAPFNPNKLKKLEVLIENDRGELDMDKYRDIWGEWYGKERAYFIESINLFKSLSSNKLKVFTEELMQPYERKILTLADQFMEDEIPNLLILDQAKWKEQLQDANNEWRSNTLLPHLIPSFNGKTKTEEVVKKASHLQFEIGAILKELYQKEVLVPVDA